MALSAAVPALAAGDPAAVAAVEAFLRDDEKAMLAAVLADKAAAADFNADVKLAGSDAKVMKLVLDKWRGRVVSYAEADSRIGTPDLEGTYKNSSSMMTPATRAYLVRRLKTMKDADRNSLIEYLDAVDSALADNGGKLTWYTKKVVSGIFDKYRQDLGTYLPEPIAKNGKAAAPAAAAALAELRKAAEQPVPTPVVVKEPVKDPIVAKKPPVVADPKKPVVPDPKEDALEQARRTAEAAERGGKVMDGGGAAPNSGGVVGGSDGGQRPPVVLSPPTGAVPSIVGNVPSPVDPDEDFMSSVKKMKTGSGPLQPRQYLPGAAGALLGALIGFLIGGPVGAVIGAGVGLVGGDIAGGKLFK